MRRARDFLGLALVAGGLILGAGVALLASVIAPGAIGPGQVAPAATPTLAPSTAQDRIALGDRTAGRTAFRLNCQDCHTQGRQSFPPEARGRVDLMATRIREGVVEMPAFASDRVPDDTLRHILTYISVPSEPEPPAAPSPRARGVNLEILEAIGKPGEPATVRFRVRDDASQVIASNEMATLALTVGGPTVDYQWFVREDARRAQPLPDGSSRYTFVKPLPDDAAGTYAASIEGAINSPSPSGPTVLEVGVNVVAYFAVTDPAPVRPRMIVSMENCNQCHGMLALHGGTRNSPEFCVICHMASHTDVDKRQTAGGPMPPESVTFRNFIHRIHTGEDLNHPFIVYGGNPANPQPVDLAAVEPFPKDRANCTVCHLPGTFVISDALARSSPMTASVNGQVVRQVPPITSVCTGCHDSDRTMAHAANQTTPQGVETCAVCHGPGRPYSVAAVHRIAPRPSPVSAPTASRPGG